MATADRRSGLEAALADTRLLVDLINTRYVGDQHDELADAGAERWVREHLSNGRGHYRPSALAALRQVREGLRELAAVNCGGQADEDSVALAQSALDAASLVVSTRAGISLRSTAAEGSVEHLVAQVAAALVSSQVTGSWRRVKVCAQPSCRWAFFDLSRNGSRRWCDMSECGNRAKNRAWRARQEA